MVAVTSVSIPWGASSADVGPATPYIRMAKLASRGLGVGPRRDVSTTAFLNPVPTGAPAERASSSHPTTRNAYKPVLWETGGASTSVSTLPQVPDVPVHPNTSWPATTSRVYRRAA